MTEPYGERTWLCQVKILMRSALVAALAAAALSCGGSDPQALSQRTFDRPVDIAFACYGGLRITNGQPASADQQVVISAQPVEACNIRSQPRGVADPIPVPPGQEPLTGLGASVPGADWYSFILQSAPGTVAIATFPTKPNTAFAGADVLVLDADPLTPGKNGISVGEDPVAIATDKGGCYAVVANAGSCDMSALDITSALDADPAVRVNRVPVVNASDAEILAKPATMVVEPPGGAIGEACPALPTGTFYVAYPSCHMVAAVQMQQGPNGDVARVVAGIDLSTGVPTLTDGNISCPAECGGGGTFTAGPRPIALDLEKDARTGSIQMVIGSENSPAMTLVELGADGLPLSARSLGLEGPNDGSFGVTSVALSPQIGMGGSSGSINDDIASGGQFQFVYATATDDSVRVYDTLTVDDECDTQIDPRLINDVTSIQQLSCFANTDPAKPARRAGAVGPGIRLPIELGFRSATPTSVEIFRGDALEPTDGRITGATKWIGYFAVVTAASGATFVIDIDNDDYADTKAAGAPLEVNLSLAMAHHLRDALPARNLTARSDSNDLTTTQCGYAGPDPDGSTGNAGGTRATNNPTRNVPAGVIAPEKLAQLPLLRQVLCEGEDLTGPVSEIAFPVPDELRDLTFQDLIALRDENWTLTYEGSLSTDSPTSDIDGPAVRVSQMHVDETGLHLTDGAKPFCDAGVENFDVVQLRGCDPGLGDAQCPLGYTCYTHPNSTISGLGACMLEDEANRLADACRDFLISARRYTVGRSEAGDLRLQPRRRMLYTSPIDGCVDDNQCTALADYAVEQASSNHPIQETDPNGRTYACLPDPDRPPLDSPNQTGNRCLETCTTDHACSTGSICREGVCFEGVIPPQSCINAPQRYELRAHDAFTLVGSQSGYVHSIIKDPNGERCIRDPNAHPFEVGRLPLNPPACDPTADPRTGRRPDGTFGPNPCTTTVDHSETAPNYSDPATCTVGDPATLVRTRQAEAIEFRNRGFTIHLVDTTYPGDAQCIRDRGGRPGFDRIPLVFPGLQLTWRQTGGLLPLTLGIRPAFPIKVRRGPTESIWVIDEGDFLSTSVGEDSTRGKVYRIEVIAPTLVNTLQ